MIKITVQTARQLIQRQFPKWAHLPVRPVEKSGHDNRTFHLGDDMAIRLPSGPAYAPQIEKELKWLPILKEHISIPISSPISKGEPDACYPLPWSVNRFLKGNTVHNSNIGKLELAGSLAGFLRELQAVDTTGAPVPGPHNFYRGGRLSIYHKQTDAVFSLLKGELPIDELRTIWNRAISANRTSSAVWLHGDIAPGNLLVDDGVLCGIIDFGIMGVGDPACDYAMAWTFFDQKSRPVLLEGLDQDTIDRARGWALWKALITYRSDVAEVSDNASMTMQAILEESAGYGSFLV